jgi:hypothetical protein
MKAVETLFAENLRLEGEVRRLEEKLRAMVRVTGSWVEKSPEEDTV